MLELYDEAVKMNNYRIKDPTSLRSVIQRTFGVWKKKWRILCDFPRYNIEVQKRVVVATMGLHNFIRISNFIDDDFAETLGQSPTDNVDLEHNSNDMETIVTPEGDAMANIREQIANTLWANKNRMY